MTEEQIKQNAVAYADCDDSEAMHRAIRRVAYIAGAHSRDEEIRELLEKYTYKIDSLIAQKEDLQEELDKLRNPWISVEERLPEENTKVLVAFYNGSVTYLNNIGIGDINFMKKHQEITHWMTIPQVPKGGEK